MLSLKKFKEMKFKQQEETPQKNPFLDSIIDLIVVNKQFLYVIKSFKENVCPTVTVRIGSDCKQLIKLAISLNPEHVFPTMTVEYSPASSNKDLVKLEEKYYNMLKEIANNALEENNAEVFSYLSNMICHFNHYFCTLDEDNDSRETSS